MNPKFVLLLSGGLDSVTLLYQLVNEGEPVHCVLFNYGQTHVKELNCAKAHCEKLKVPYTVIELWQIKNLFLRSAITDRASDSPIVPNRNAIMLHIAAAIAQGLGAKRVAIGCNKDDQAFFPDCTTTFLYTISESMFAANLGVKVYAPFVATSKKVIKARAKNLGIDPASVWSCYEGGQEPCGKCQACRVSQ